MPRSAGVTVSAVIVFLGSAFSVLCGAVMLVTALASLYSDRIAPGSDFNVKIILAVESAVFFGFAGWGIASGVGLIKTKQWARISLLIYAGILAFFSVICAAAMAIVPLPDSTVKDPNLPGNFLVMVRVGFVLFFAVFAALGGFWLYFFNTRDVKAQFLGLQPVMGYTATGSWAEIPGSGVGAVQGKRPLSISIIAWYLLVTSVFALPIFALQGVDWIRAKAPFA